MAKRPRRRFTVADALILVAAVALGLAWMRHFQDCEAGGESYPYNDPDSPTAPVWHAIKIGSWWGVSLEHCVATVAIALVALRLLGRPRRPLRRLTCLPGTVAGAAVLLTVALDLVNSAVEVLVGVKSGAPYDSLYQFTYLSISGDKVALAVAGAWALLAIGGRWRPEADWLDRAGIALGAFWVPQALVSYVIRIVYVNNWG